MRLGLLIYGSLETLRGGYLYDRKLVEYLRAQGETVEILSLPWRNYAAHLTDNLRFRIPSHLDLLIQDELNHPSLLCANRRPHPYPLVSLVHHLRCSEQRPAWQNRFYRLIEKRYLQSVDGFIFNSQTTKRVVNKVLENNTVPGLVAYPPTDHFGHPVTEAEVAGRAQEPGPLRVLFLGNLIRRKGLHTLLEAIRLQPSAFRLDIAGGMAAEPKYAQAMQEKTRILGLESRVSFHGALEREALTARLRAAQVLAVPSSYEGFGIVYLEGMAFGLPVIGTTHGAAPELITDGHTGYLIEPGDAHTLAERLLRLASDRSLLTELALHALERYRRQPSWEQTAGSIRQFLYSIALQNLSAAG